MSNKRNYQKVTCRCILMVALPVRRSWIIKKKTESQEERYYTIIPDDRAFSRNSTSIQEGCIRGTQFTFHLLRMSYKRRSRYPTEDQFCVFPYKEVNIVKEIQTFSNTLQFVFLLIHCLADTQHFWFIITIILLLKKKQFREHGGSSVSVCGAENGPPPSHIQCFLLMMTGSPQACTCPHLGRSDWFPWTWSTALSPKRFQMRVEPRMDVTSWNFHMNSRQDVDFLFISHPPVCHTGHYGFLSFLFSLFIYKL